jgi:predicted CopG family antitoxin
MSTNIPVSEQVWRELNSRKNPGDSFDDVLRRELGLVNHHDRADAEAAAAATGLGEDWQAALVAVWEHLREVGEASPSDIRDAVHPEHPCDSGQQWWWKKLSDEIDQLPGVERASQRRFEYTGD